MKSIAITFFFLIALAGCSNIKDFVIENLVFDSTELRPAKYHVKTKTLSFKTTDGVKLASDVYLPKEKTKAPTILIRIPFSRNFLNEVRSEFIARHWATRGYAVVVQGTRGRYKSSGEFYPLINEKQDGIETLTWIHRQKWFNGQVLMWGGSAFGHTQWAIADQDRTDIKAFSIQIASSNFRKMFFPGNAFALESALYWTIRSHGKHDRDVKLDDLLKGTNHLPIIESDNKAIGDTDFYNDWLANYKNDKFWETIDGKDRAKNLKAPVLLLAGWYDPFLPSQLDDYLEIKKNTNQEIVNNTHLIIGPWAHAQTLKMPSSKDEIPYRIESVMRSTQWFDSLLKLSKTDSSFSAVKLYVMGEDRWRNENEWPLARTVYTDFYLQSAIKANSVNGDGFLSMILNPKNSKFDSFQYDPIHPVPTAGGAMLSFRAGVELQNTIEVRDDVLVYSTPALSKKVEVTGPIRLILFVSTDAKSTDFTAKLVDVYPDGRAYNLSEGILRRDYHSNSPNEIEIELSPTSNVFFEGHKLRLEISSSNFPRYNRNLNTAESMPTASRAAKANQKVYHSDIHPSRLILSIIP